MNFKKLSSIAIIAAFLFNPNISFSMNTAVGLQTFAGLSAEVDPQSGSASMGIPIVVAPGRAGIQPSLQLQYSSSLPNGIAGVGWGLELGSIQVATKNGTPKYDSTDTYVLIQQGSRQNLVHDPSAGFYRTEIEGGFSKIEKNGSQWLLTDKRGTQYFFGQTSASQQYDPANPTHIFKWCLDRIEDIHGNYMTITYDGATNASWPKTIEYTGNDSAPTSLPTHAKVTFAVEPRTDHIINYKPGFLVQLDQRLKEIKVEVGTDLYTRYELTYEDSGITARSLLTSVTQYGADGVSALPAMTFTYEDELPVGGGSAFSLASGWSIPQELMFSDPSPPNTSGKDLGIRVADVNADGYPDMIRNTEQNQMIFLHNKQTAWADGAWSLPPHGPYLNSNVLPEFVNVGASPYYARGVAMADVNSDGWTDMVRHYKVDATGQVLNEVYINNKTNGWTLDTSWAMPTDSDIFREFENSKSEFMGTIFSDLNGDGYTDIIRSKEDINGGPENSHKSFLNNQMNSSTGWTETTDFQTLSMGSHNLGKSTRLVDLNGDGLPDLFHPVSVHMNDGTGFVHVPNSPWINATANFTNGSTQVVDINGDGLVDLLVLDGTTSVFINTGSGWAQTSAFQINDGQASFVDFSTKTLDANADGMLDFIIHSENIPPKLYLNTLKPSDRLIEVDNGVGGVTTLEYGPSTAYDNTHLPFVTQVVKSVTVSDSIDSSYTTNYEYADGLFDTDAREFRGFGMVKVVDPEGNYTISEFHQDDIKKGRPIKQESYDASDNLLSKAVNEWDAEAIASGVNFVFLKRRENYVYNASAEAKATAEEFFYEELAQFGNLTKTVQLGEIDPVTALDVPGDSRTIETEYHNNDTGGNWLIGNPKHIVVKDDADASTRETWFYYDGSNDLVTLPTEGLLTKKQSWDGDPAQADPVTQYTYDAYGNLKTTIDPNLNVTTITYDSTYQIFPLTTQNAKGHSVVNTYCGVDGEPLTAGLWGQLGSTTDPNLETGKKMYDVFGRVVKTVSPLDTEALPTTSVSYDFQPTYTKITTSQRIEHGQSATIDVAQFTDGLGRVIQTKSPTETAGQFVVTGQVQYNSRGLPTKQYLPFYSTNPIDTIESIVSTRPHTITDYDASGRVVKATNPDDTYSTVDYDRWTTTTINENGHQQKSYFDAYGRLIKKEEYTGADGRGAPEYPSAAYVLYARTLYNYNSEGDLTSVIDDHDNTTTMTYDNLGRKTSMTDPDMGYWQYGYDANGNLTWQIDAKGQQIDFQYDEVNRLLTKVDTAATPTMDVDYTYDDQLRDFSKGRLTKAQYSGLDNTEFNYDELGREVWSKKKIGINDFTVTRDYDALNNLVKVQYPDGEDVFYKYNAAGQIEAVANDPTLFLASAGPQNQIQDSDTVLAKRNVWGHLGDHFTRAGGWIEENIFGIKRLDAQSNEYHWLETEYYDTITAPFQQGTTGAASEGKYIHVPDGVGYHGSTSSVAATFDVNITAAGDYVLWGRGYAIDGGADSFFVQMDSGTAHLWDIVNTPSWTWDKANDRGVADPVIFNLSAGQHTITIKPREDGAKIDKILLTNDMGYTPSGVGQPAENLPGNPPGAPVQSAPISGDTVVDVSWSSVVDADDYQVKWGTTNGGPYPNTGAWTTATSQQVTGLTNGQTYYFVVVARNADGTSDDSNEQSATPEAPPTAGPEDFTTYTEVDQYGDITRTTDCVTFTGIETKKSNSYVYKEGSPIGDFEHEFDSKLTTVDNWSYSAIWGISETAETVNDWTNGLFIAMFKTDTNLYILFDQVVNGSTTVWDGVTNYDQAQANTRYYFTVKREGNTLTAKVYTDAARTTLVHTAIGTTSMAGSTQLKYVVPYSARDMGLSGKYQTGDVCHLNLDTAVPAAPANLNVTSITNTSIGLSWNAVAGATGYTIKYGTTSGNYTSGDIPVGNVTSYTVDSLTTNTMYYFTVVATNASGSSVLSNEVAATPKTAMLYVQDVDYNEFGQITRIEYGNGVVTDNSYDPDTLRLVRRHTMDENLVPLQDLNYAYDSLGNIVSITDAVHTATQSFVYDEQNRLIQADGNYCAGSLCTLTYAYDSIGNLISKDGLAYTYGEGPAGPHAVTSLSDGTMYTYDANGNMASRVQGGVTRTFVYDMENRLVEVQDGGVPVASFEYDGDGGRTRKTTYSGGASTINYVGSLYEERGSDKTNYIFFGDTRVASNTNGVVYFYHQDHLGGTNVLTDTQGVKQEKVEYKPFGEIINHEKYGTGPETAHFYFTGKKLDDETGLMYYGARYYNPSLGRFLTPDSIVPYSDDSQAFNRYSYVRNNPVNLVDPTGHFFKKLFKSIGKFFKKAAGIIIGVAVTAVTFGAGAPFAAALGVGAFVGTTSGALINGVPVGKAFGLGIVAGLTAGFGAHYAIGAGFWSGVGIGAGFGAVGGAASAAILGADPLRGAFAGGVAGGIMGAVGGVLPEAKLSNLAKLGVGGAAAAASGASSAAIARGNVGESAALGVFGYLVSNVAFSLSVDNHIVNNRKTRSALDQAWKDSQQGNPHEEGGFFNFGKGGKIEAQRWPSGQQAAIRIPPVPANAVATFHTHPNVGPGWVQGPSAQDIRVANYLKLDGLVMSKTDIYSYGPKTPIGKGSFDNRWPR